MKPVLELQVEVGVEPWREGQSIGKRALQSLYSSMFAKEVSIVGSGSSIEVYDLLYMYERSMRIRCQSSTGRGRATHSNAPVLRFTAPVN